VEGNEYTNYAFDTSADVALSLVDADEVLIALGTDFGITDTSIISLTLYAQEDGTVGVTVTIPLDYTDDGSNYMELDDHMDALIAYFASLGGTVVTPIEGSIVTSVPSIGGVVDQLESYTSGDTLTPQWT
jgi:hypothetical protein